MLKGYVATIHCLDVFYEDRSRYVNSKIEIGYYFSLLNVHIYVYLYMYLCNKIEENIYT